MSVVSCLTVLTGVGVFSWLVGGHFETACPQTDVSRLHSDLPGTLFLVSFSLLHLGVNNAGVAKNACDKIISGVCLLGHHRGPWVERFLLGI